MANTDTRIAFSFRARLVIVMTMLLIGSFAMVQYLNQRTQREVQAALEHQKRKFDETFFAHVSDITQATNFALESLKKNRYIYELLEEPEYQSILDRNSIRHVLVVEENGLVADGSERELIDEKIQVPVVEGAAPLGWVQKGDPAAALEGEADSHLFETYWTRVETRRVDDGSMQVYWIAIVVSNAQVATTIEESQRDVAAVVESTAMGQSRLTLGVFALAAALAVVLVWRFTRPLQRLSAAAERVARGDLDFAVDIRRRDEIGQLAETFNGMISGLKAKSELEERLNNAERAAVIGRLTSAIAHEIRNPLNFITLSVDHVRSKFPPAAPRDRERFERLLGSVKEETGRLNRLVNDVLNFGRPASLNVRTVDLREIVDAVIGVVRTQAEEQGVEIETVRPDEPVEVEADGEKLKSCISNVVINAVQAMPTGGRLRVEVTGDPDEARVRVSDTGVGIPAEALDRVFEPYYSTKDTGTGLGLAVTRKIVDEHGGRIRVESTPGEGTTFEVDLPRRRTRAGEQERPSLAGMRS
jgi:signal transduction histidine kinase